MEPMKRKLAGSTEEISARNANKKARIDRADTIEPGNSPSPSPEQSSKPKLSSNPNLSIGNQDTAVTDIFNSAEITATSSQHLNRAPSTVDSILLDLRKLQFTAVRPPEEVINAVGGEIISGMRPGPCLLGTKVEEAELYRSKESVETEQAKQGGTENADIKMEEIKDEEDSGPEMEAGDFLEYKASNKKMKSEDEEELGEYEELSYGHSFVQLPGSHEVVGVWEYFGAEWDARIEKLYSIQPLPVPENMTIEPRNFQLKAAAQGLYCLYGPFKLFLLGDDMGVGKTLTCILMIWMMRKEPGMSIVLCPKNLCQHWVDQIHGAWEERCGLRAFIVDDSNITQAQLLAGGYDVLVCSYEFYAANGKNMKDFEERIIMAANDTSGTVPQPRRPTSALQTEMWKILNMPFKTAFLDEAQRVNKKGKLRHDAIKENLHARAFAIISGTLPHNIWHNMFGYIDFGKGHPFDTFSKFLHCFSDFDQSYQIQTPSPSKLALLQKFLQPMLVARPATILRLKECKRFRVPFKLHPVEQIQVDKWAFEYEKISGINNSASGTGQVLRIDLGDSDTGVFGLAVKAQQAAFHPMLAAEINNLRLRDFRDGGIEEGLQDPIEEDYGGNKRDEWLEKVKVRPNIVEESGRVIAVIYLYQWVRQTFPEEKIIIFSSSLKFLDIVAEAIRRRYDINPLRFDGTIPAKQRKFVENSFERCRPEIPLLITMNAGGVGLNIQHASIVMITEPQWNKNAEAQAVSRAYRQGQEKIVKALMLCGANSKIDSIILGIQKRKAAVNAALMGPLIREPDEGPAHIEILSYPGLLPLDYS